MENEIKVGDLVRLSNQHVYTYIGRKIYSIDYFFMGKSFIQEHTKARHFFVDYANKNKKGGYDYKTWASLKVTQIISSDNIIKKISKKDKLTDWQGYNIEYDWNSKFRAEQDAMMEEFYLSKGMEKSYYDHWSNRHLLTAADHDFISVNQRIHSLTDK